jgi:hypothetical protein
MIEHTQPFCRKRIDVGRVVGLFARRGCCLTVEIVLACLTVKVSLPDMGPRADHQRWADRHPHQGFRTIHRELMLFVLIVACRSCPYMFSRRTRKHQSTKSCADMRATPTVRSREPKNNRSGHVRSQANVDGVLFDDKSNPIRHRKYHVPK